MTVGEGEGDREKKGVEEIIKAKGTCVSYTAHRKSPVLHALPSTTDTVSTRCAVSEWW